MDEMNQGPSSPDLTRFADAMLKDWERNPDLYPTIRHIERHGSGLTIHAISEGLRKKISITWADLVAKRNELFRCIEVAQA